MNEANEVGRRVILVTGGVGSGKTTLARALIRDERGDGRTVGGVISEKIPYRTGSDGRQTWCYEFVDVATGSRMRYAEPRAIRLPDRNAAEGRAGGRYIFSDRGFRFAEEVLDAARDRDVVVIDEVGPLELRGGGLWRSTLDLLENSRTDLILCVRGRLVGPLSARLPAGVTPMEVHTAAGSLTRR